MTRFSEERFCDGCGAECRRVERLVEYSSHDGTPKYQGFYVCPKRRWWSMTSHTDDRIFMDWHFGPSDERVPESEEPR